MRLRNWIPTLAYATLAFLTPITTAAMAGVPVTDTEANKIIDRMLSLPHGLYLVPPEIHDLFSVLVEHPEVFLPLLSARMESLGPASPEPLDARKIGRSMGVLSLASAWGAATASKLVNTTLRAGFRRAAEFRASSADSDHDRGLRRDVLLLHNLDLLCGSALKILTEFEDSEAVDEVVMRLGKAKIALRTNMLRYLVKVAPLRPDIRPKLEEMYNSPDSPLRNHPQLLRVLEAMDKAAAEQKKEGDDNENRDRRRKDE